MSNHSSGIYKLTCTANGHYYYGQAQDFARRWLYHKGALRRNQHDNPRLQNTWNKYGKDAFTFDVEMDCPIDKLNQIEQVYLDVYADRPDCMNIGIDATSAMRGRRQTSEARRKMSEGNKGRPHTEEHRRRIGEARKGKKHSEETRQKVSKAHKGKLLSEQHRRKISETLYRHYAQKRIEALADQLHGE